MCNADRIGGLEPDSRKVKGKKESFKKNCRKKSKKESNKTKGNIRTCNYILLRQAALAH